MLSAYHPTEDTLISYNKYLEYTIEHDLQDRNDALKARCPICNDSMIIVAGKERADGHFRHESRNFCPTKTDSAAPYENLRPSEINPDVIESNKEFVRENINNIWFKLKELAPFLSVDEVVAMLQRAKELNVYGYANLDTELIVYVYVNLINFLPRTSYKRRRKYKFLFFYQSDNNEADLWINRGRPSQLFRISYDKKKPLKVVRLDSTPDYLNNNESQANARILQRILREI
uniref:hypothetical protein n=1 Tax=Psychrobacter sp. TaxID=56811 RepID=UPI00159B0ED1|nr:hypothetical protein [Psychrobacter sp.]QJS05789.1 hypothetical protein [Psychrobacter sp.]